MRDGGVNIWRVMSGAWLASGFLLALVAIAPADVITVQFEAERQDYTWDRKQVTLWNDVRIRARVVEDPDHWVTMTGDYAEGDLTSGRFELLGNVLVVTPDGSMSGEAVVYNATTGAYQLRQGGLMVQIAEPQGSPVYGFLYAGEVRGSDEIIYLTRGTLTTCDRVHPHWAAHVDSLRYDVEKDVMTIRNGSLSLYGLEIPLVPELSFAVVGDRETTSGVWPMPGYSSRDGIRLGWLWTFGRPDVSPRARIDLDVTQYRGLRWDAIGESRIGEDITAHLRVSRQEDADADFDRYTTFDRMPELGIVSSLDQGEETGLDVSLLLGRYHEFDNQRDLPEIRLTEERARLELQYIDGRSSRRNRDGRWWWVGASGSLYGTGDHYEYLTAGAGLSFRPTSWLSSSLEARHHAISGDSPFEFDDVDIRSELSASADVHISDVWGANLAATYDLENGLTRDWEMQLRRREHCLTWIAGYREVGNRFSIGLELNGILGNNEAPDQRDLEQGPPPYWEARRDLEQVEIPQPADISDGIQMERE